MQIPGVLAERKGTWEGPKVPCANANLAMFRCASYSSASSVCVFPTHLRRLGTRQIVVVVKLLIKTMLSDRLK